MIPFYENNGILSPNYPCCTPFSGVMIVHLAWRLKQCSKSFHFFIFFFDAGVHVYLYIRRKFFMWMDLLQFSMGNNSCELPPLIPFSAASIWDGISRDFNTLSNGDYSCSEFKSKGIQNCPPITATYEKVDK